MDQPSNRAFTCAHNLSGKLDRFGYQIEHGLIECRRIVPDHLAAVIAESARYHGRMVDFADASLMVLSDLQSALPIITADRNDFAVYLRSRTRRTLVTR